MAQTQYGVVGDNSVGLGQWHSLGDFAEGLLTFGQRGPGELLLCGHLSCHLMKPLDLTCLHKARPSSPCQGAAPHARILCPVLGRPALGEDFSAAYTLPISEQELLSSCLFILPGAVVREALLNRTQMIPSV